MTLHTHYIFSTRKYEWHIWQILVWYTDTNSGYRYILLLLDFVHRVTDIQNTIALHFGSQVYFWLQARSTWSVGPLRSSCSVTGYYCNTHKWYPVTAFSLIWGAQQIMSFLPEDGSRAGFWNVKALVFFYICYTMHKVHKKKPVSVCYSPSSKPYSVES